MFDASQYYYLYCCGCLAAPTKGKMTICQDVRSTKDYSSKFGRDGYTSICPKQSC